MPTFGSISNRGKRLFLKRHRRQEPFCVDRKNYAKLSAFVKYVIKFVGGANPITNFEFVEEYVKNNKPTKYLMLIFLVYPIPNLDYVSHTRFNCAVIAKPFRYLNYEEDYVSCYESQIINLHSPVVD